jgi:hypothetical protein
MAIKRPYLYAAGLWLILVGIFFWPVIFQGKVLAPLDIMDSLLRPWATTEKIQVHNAFTYDAISQYLPYDYSVYQSLQQDGYIGWNPYTHSGSSIVENTMICPGDWHHHLYRFLPFWTAWNTGIIVQFTLAGLGMLFLLRDQKIPAAHALVGVLAFGLYSQFTLWIYHRWVLGAMCWAPWILWALFRAKRSGRIIDLPSIAFIALAFRGGHLQTCVFVVLLVGLVAISDWWQTDQRWTLRQVWKTLLPYAVVGVLGSILALDVIIETIPALLHGKRDMPSRSWVDALFALPTLATSVFPTMMGTPQGLDLMKVFRVGLFDIKFMGAIPLLLAALALFRRKAPAPAKLLLVFGLLLPFTPADQWLYSRFTVLFALGGAWLAAWYLTMISTEPPSKVWKRALLVLSLMAGAWLLGSTLITAQHSLVEAKLHEVVLAKLPADKTLRADWMLSRADLFLKDSMVWAPRNLAMVALIALGIFGCSHIHHQSTKAPRFALLVAFCTFGEILLFSSTWMTFSPQPSGKGLYEEPAWATRLKEEVGSGTILCLDRSDFDYMQLNTPSAYGIRFADGYETVTPRRIDPASDGKHDPARCADIGISHLLASPDKDPGSIPGWVKVDDSKEFVLYKNPLFQGICTAELIDGGTLPLSAKFESNNRRSIELPAMVKAITLTESFNPGWKYTLDGQTWRPVQETDLHSIRIDMTSPSQGQSTTLRLQYRPAYQPYYRVTMGLTACSLLGFAALRSRREARVLT